MIQIYVNILGSIDFTTSSWISSLTIEQTITRTVDDYTFTIIYDGNTVTINGFPVTVNDWDKALGGETVTLKSPTGKTATLTYKKPNIVFNGNPFSGRKISNQITYGPSGPSGPTTTTQVTEGIFKQASKLCFFQPT